MCDPASPYSPDLALAVPPPKVKLALKVEHFSDISDIQSRVTELLKGFP